MTISQAISNANSGLAAAGRGAAVTSNNIANALTEGYATRTVSQSEVSTPGGGGGVRIDGVNRASNPGLTLERRGADASLSRSETEANALGRISDLLGAPEDPNALFAKFARLESALQSLANNPSSAAEQQNSVVAAKDIVKAFNGIADAYQQIRTEADADIAQGVAIVNETVVQIHKLNDAIQKASVSSGDLSGLVDRRQQLIDQVNEYIPVREIQRDNGVVDLMTTQGVFLLAGQPRNLQFTPSPVITAQTDYNAGAGPLSGLTIDGIDIAPGGAGSQRLSDGKIAGHFAVRDTIVPEMSVALDALAFDLVERFSDPTLDPTLPAGAPGLFTDAGAAANPATITGIATRLSINAAVDPSAGGEVRRMRDGIGSAAPGPAGSDVIVRALITGMNNTRTMPVGLQAGSDLSAEGGAAHLTALVGGARSSANLDFESAKVLSERLTDAETLEVGVDTDRELQRLLAIEQAYAANAQVIQVADQMIERLLEAVR